MDELLKYRQKITGWTIFLIAISVAAIAIMLAAAPNFGKNSYALILLLIIVAQILIASKIGMMGGSYF